MRLSRIFPPPSSPPPTFLHTPITLSAWIRSCRHHKSVSFITVNDGTTTRNLQVVVPAGMVANHKDRLTTGACITLGGELKAHPTEVVEMQANSIQVIGPCEADEYPLAKKYHTNEFLRSPEVAHLRSRSAMFSSILRLRSKTAAVLRTFLEDEEDFTWVSTPILSGNDCEGAGEVFQVSAPSIPNFFNVPSVWLTVSGQLHAEQFATGMGRVYTFGPTFRSENSNTTRHLSEFWMLEPEFCFANVQDAMNLAAQCVRVAAGNVLDKCQDEMDVLLKYGRESPSEEVTRGVTHDGLEARLKLASAPSDSFPRLSYKEAVDILQTRYGLQARRAPLSSDHEKLLVQHCGGCPVLVYDYPREIKPFYALANNDELDTAAAFDLLVPGIGELVGGSAREHRYDVLKERMTNDGIMKDLQWYLDLRRYGSAPHAGFGIGFDRLIQFLSGASNIRDVVPCVRARGEMLF